LTNHTFFIPIFFNQIAEYISRNYPRAQKIVEIGVGFAPWTAIRLRELLPAAEIIVVDKNPEALNGLEKYGINPLQDDVFKPKIRRYVGADLIYSIHPPVELIEPIRLIADTVNAELLVKPLSEDAYLYGFEKWKKVTLGSCVIFLWNTPPLKP